MSKRHTVVVQFDNDTGDTYLPIPDELMIEAGWNLGDVLQWTSNEDGSFTLSKAPETEIVMVEAISSFRMRYAVAVPKGKSAWALDTVTCNEAKEFSQEHIGENITSHRVIDREEYLRMFDEDNSYLKSWTEEQKFKMLTDIVDDTQSTIVPMPGTIGSAKVTRPEDRCSVCGLTREQLGADKCFDSKCGLK